ncbi:MAG: hypothetical protein ABS76_36955 [Pelagibacterium sp. SCN 64-44]|nr:MAG: hypothetical protein ABS76_36955 [Pelagibacterium sp. SCN 64-44]
MADRNLPHWRSILFVPVLNERFVSGAPTRGADCIQLDLEDAIPPDSKQEARERVGAVADQLHGAGCDVIVRINRPWRMALADIAAAVRPSVTALTLPKVPGAGHVDAICEVLEDIERERGMEIGHTRLIVMIETAAALSQMEAIARASQRIIGVIVGAEDLAVSMGMRPTHRSLLVPNVQAVAAARAAGCMPLGFVGSVAGYSDLDTYRDLIREARELGFTGAFAIHPNQVPVLNAEFAPSQEEVEAAQALIEAFEAGRREGRGAISHLGKMVDLPVVEQAEAILAAHGRFASRRL